MKIEEAIVYVMVKRNGGMTTDQIADAINRHRLHLRKDGQPVTSKQVYATICLNRSVGECEPRSEQGGISQYHGTFRLR